MIIINDDMKNSKHHQHHQPNPVVLLVRYIMKFIVNDNDDDINKNDILFKYNKIIDTLHKLTTTSPSTSTSSTLLLLNDNINKGEYESSLDKDYDDIIPLLRLNYNIIINKNNIKTALNIISSSINNITRIKRMREEDDNNNKNNRTKVRRLYNIGEVILEDNINDDNNDIEINKEWLYNKGRRTLNISSAKYLCERIGINNNIIEKSELISTIVDSIWDMNNKELYWLYTGNINYNIKYDNNNKYLGKSFIKLLKLVKDENAKKAIREAKREIETTIKLYNKKEKEVIKGRNVNNNTTTTTSSSSSSSSSAHNNNITYDTNCDYGKIIEQALNNIHCPFATLGLDSTNTCITDVKKRWAKLILTLHPDKAPLNWRNNDDMARLLNDALQKVNEAKRKCESLLEHKTLKRPLKPILPNNNNEIYKITTSKNGKRAIEIHWSSPNNEFYNSKIDKYYIFLQKPNKTLNDRYPVGSVNDSSDPWVVISEDDARFSNFFLYDTIIVYITSFNSVGYSEESLTINIPLNNNGIKLLLLNPNNNNNNIINNNDIKKWYNDIVSSLLSLRNNITTLRNKLSKLRVDELKNIIRYNIKDVPRGNKPLLIETITDAIINNNINYIA